MRSAGVRAAWHGPPPLNGVRSSRGEVLGEGWDRGREPGHGFFLEHRNNLSVVGSGSEADTKRSGCALEVLASWAPDLLTSQGLRCQLHPTLSLSVFYLLEYPRVGPAGVYMHPVLLWEAFCPGKLSHHQHLPPGERQHPHLQHLFSECRAGGGGIVAARRGWPLWPGLKSHRTTKGWSQTVPPRLLFTVLCG